MHLDFLKVFKLIKSIQLAILIGIEISFFLILFFNPVLKNNIYSNSSLFAISCMMWALMLFSFGCILYDFYKMQHFSKNTHKLNQLAYLDNMTGIPNRYSCDLIFKIYQDGKNMDQIGCGIIEIANLIEINNKYGHEAGDLLIQDFSSILDEVGTDYGFVGRNNGNEFLAVLENCTSQKMNRFFTHLQNRIDLYNKNSDQAILEITFSYVLNSDLHLTRFSDLIILAYEKLHHISHS